MRNPASLLLEKRPNVLVERCLTDFEREIGGRAVLVELLAHGHHDEEVDYLWSLLADPLSQDRSLAKLCLDGGIKPQRMIQLIREGEMAKAHTRSLRKVARMLPDVTEDAMRRALPRRVKCPQCCGKDPVCGACDGTGRVEKEPSLQRQKLALELGGMTQKSPGIVVQQNQFTAMQVQGLRDFQVKSDRALYDADVEDAQVVEEP